MASSELLAAQALRNAKAGSKPNAARALVAAIPSSKILTATLPKPKSWYLLNTDTREVEFGQFEPDDLQERVSSAYGNTFALNRQRAITQFLHGEVETISFSARYYSLHALQDIQSRVARLKAWTRRDSELGRPPILYFWVGNQYASMSSCVLLGVQITYDRPGFLGSMQGATVSVSLQRYDPFSLTETSTFDTLYYYSKLGDSYELLAARQYQNPMLGIELRDRHPKHRRLEPGTRVKLPAPTGSLRLIKPAPKSITLRGITDKRRDTQQKAELSRILSLRSRPVVGHVIL